VPTDPTAPHTTSPRFAVYIALSVALVLGGCAGPGDQADGTQGAGTDETAGGAPTAREARPARTTDTIRIEGMGEPIELRLFEAPEDVALPFTAYIPDDMAAEVGDGGSVDFIAEFGGIRNEDAFIHFYAFPEGTPWQEAVATAKGFKSGQGIPVSEGLEPLQDDIPRPDGLGWAEEAYRYVHQSGGELFGGRLGLGIWDGRAFMIVTHRAAEYAEGFDPRARLVLESWRWADGSPLSLAGTAGLPGPRGPLP